MIASCAMLNETQGENRFPTSTSVQRIEWLDGIRALAAGYVVLHHIWLMTYGGFPGNNGPWTTDWLIYGHLAVSVFIVVSGFSLGLAPMKHGRKMKDGGSGFLRRRFWRIVPPYWAALALSVGLIGIGLIGSPSGDQVTAKDILIHVFLVQDAFGNTSPNGVFWSIAVEWHIYFLFPAILLAYRRFGVATVVCGIALLVAGQHIAGIFVPLIGELNRFTPAYLLLFALGTASAAKVSGRTSGKTELALGILFIAAFAITLLFVDSRIIVTQYFWVDVWVGTATSLLFVALGTGKLGIVARFLSIRPLAFIGQYAFSLYLIHALVLELVRTWIVNPLELTQGRAFWAMLVVGLPCSLIGAYGFYIVCERPFLRIRSFGDLRRAVVKLMLAMTIWRPKQNTNHPDLQEPGVSRIVRSRKS